MKAIHNVDVFLAVDGLLFSKSKDTINESNSQRQKI